MTHEQAIRLALLVVGPALLLFGLRDATTSPSAHVVVAALVAAASAYGAAALMVRYSRSATLRPFGLYLLVGGAAAVWWLAR
jgi:hypothetical protein